MHDATPFLLLARKYILLNQPAKAWRAAVMAARIAQQRHDERMEVQCEYVVDTVAMLNL
jgi:hypothetical protein